MKRLITGLVAAATMVAACTPSSSGTASPNVTPTPSATTSASAASGASASASATPTAPRTTDTIPTSKGDLRVTPLKHASLLFEFGGHAIYVDPAMDAPVEGLPKADYVFITHVHPDHMDPALVDKLKKPSTIVLGPQTVADKMPGVTTLANGAKKSFGEFEVEAVAMYNLERGPAPGKLYHPKGDGDGFVFTFGDKRVYTSGDTECTPEMKALKSIDVAFVCMNLPYTMPPKEAAECVNAFAPKVVYPYHYRNSSLDDFKAGVTKPGVEVRTRNWYP
jgi:L-ascorbate metabolism protein UlaG (beta-lactamase superfamily)